MLAFIKMNINKVTLNKYTFIYKKSTMHQLMESLWEYFYIKNIFYRFLNNLLDKNVRPTTPSSETAETRPKSQPSKTAFQLNLRRVLWVVKDVLANHHYSQQQQATTIILILIIRIITIIIIILIIVTTHIIARLSTTYFTHYNIEQLLIVS